MSSVFIFAKTSTLLDVPNNDDPAVVTVNDKEHLLRKVWFKTKPVSLDFCHRVIQLQLSTDSRDQGWVSDTKQGSWSWFEVAIFEDESSDEAKVSDGRALSWRSHANRMEDDTGHYSRHFGAVFDRRSEILDDLEVSSTLSPVLLHLFTQTPSEGGQCYCRHWLYSISRMGEPREVRRASREACRQAFVCEFNCTILLD